MNKEVLQKAEEDSVLQFKYESNRGAQAVKGGIVTSTNSHGVTVDTLREKDGEPVLYEVSKSGNAVFSQPSGRKVGELEWVRLVRR